MSKLDPFDSEGYRTYYLNENKTRWFRVDLSANKDKITLSTKSGKLITRTCQYYMKSIDLKTRETVIKVKITYKQRILLVTRDTVLED